MDKLPCTPGFRFNDITKENHNLSSQFVWKNGYSIPKEKSIGIGKYPLDVDSTLYAEKLKPIRYDPTLTYGRAKDPPKPAFQPDFVRLDGKCLSFHGYTEFISTDMDMDEKKIMIRRVIITYFLVDDTICVVEPFIPNAGYAQGHLVKRAKIPNPRYSNKNYHWSDFNNGVELSFNGVKYKLCNCDLFTKNFFLTQGITIGPDEPVPNDPYIMDRIQIQNNTLMSKNYKCSEEEEIEIEKGNRFLKYDKKVLRFYAAWFDEGREPAQWRFYVFYYFLVNDKVEIYESRVMGDKSEKIRNPLFLSKSKLPKDRLDLPKNFPTIYLEVGINDGLGYYEAKDLIIGKTIFVLNRRFLLYDCDTFTRKYYKDILKINQPDPIQVVDPKFKSYKCHWVIPPHTGVGDPDDTLQNCMSLMPKPPKTYDFVTYVMDAFKYLRFKLKMEPLIEVDNHRNFLLEYCLGNDKMSITEVPTENSGFYKGKIVAPTRIRKHGTKLEDNQFFTPKDFAIGAKLRIRGITYIIIDMDLWTYNYMIKNEKKFTEEAINGAKQMFKKTGFKRSEKNEALKQNFITQKIF